MFIADNANEILYKLNDWFYYSLVDSEIECYPTYPGAQEIDDFAKMYVGL